MPLSGCGTYAGNYLQKDTSGWNGILFEEEAGTVYGTPILSQNLTIDKGETLTISQNASLTVAKSVQVQNNGVVKTRVRFIITVSGRARSRKETPLLQMPRSSDFVRK